MRRIILAATVIIACIAISFILPGCKEPETITETVVETVTETVVETVEVEVEKEEAEVEKFTVAFSNGLITHSWRTQMTSDIVQECSYYQGQGVVDELLIQHAGDDIDVQIQQIRNLINAGVDLLIVNPNSASALDPVIEEAVDQGVLVFVCNQLITSDVAYQIIPDCKAWQSKLAEYVFEELGGEGDVVYVSGFEGQPISEDRDTAFAETLEKYPGINLLNKVHGHWDVATAQQTMSTVLAAFPQIDGVVQQDGMGLGIIKAFEAANREVPIISGEGSLPFMEKWMELRDAEDYETYAIADPPGLTLNYALGVGLRMLQGKQAKEGFFGASTDWYEAGPQVAYVQYEPEFDNSTLDQIYADHVSTMGISEWIDHWPSQEELDALFE